MKRKIILLLSFMLCDRIFAEKDPAETLEEFHKELKSLDVLKYERFNFTEYNHVFWLEKGNVTRATIIKIIQTFKGRKLFGVQLSDEVLVLKAKDKYPYVSENSSSNSKVIFVIIRGCLSDTIKDKKHKYPTYGVQVTMRFFGKYDRKAGLSSINPTKQDNQIVLDVSYNRNVCALL